MPSPVSRRCRRARRARRAVPLSMRGRRNRSRGRASRVSASRCGPCLGSWPGVPSLAGQGCPSHLRGSPLPGSPPPRGSPGKRSGSRRRGDAVLITTAPLSPSIRVAKPPGSDHREAGDADSTARRGQAGRSRRARLGGPSHVSPLSRRTRSWVPVSSTVPAMVAPDRG